MLVSLLHPLSPLLGSIWSGSQLLSAAASSLWSALTVFWNTSVFYWMGTSGTLNFDPWQTSSPTRMPKIQMRKSIHAIIPLICQSHSMRTDRCSPSRNSFPSISQRSVKAKVSFQIVFSGLGVGRAGPQEKIQNMEGRATFYVCNKWSFWACF